jgi:hypothetical protein
VTRENDNCLIGNIGHYGKRGEWREEVHKYIFSMKMAIVF